MYQIRSQTTVKKEMNQKRRKEKKNYTNLVYHHGLEYPQHLKYQNKTNKQTKKMNDYYQIVLSRLVSIHSIHSLMIHVHINVNVLSLPMGPGGPGGPRSPGSPFWLFIIQCE